MVRGERDYTQRVLAQIRPTGILGGRLVMFEDFESINNKGSPFDVQLVHTSDAQEVYDGDGACEMKLTTIQPYSWALSFPCPTEDEIGIEFAFKPSDLTLTRIEATVAVYTGTTLHAPSLRLDASGALLTMEIINSDFEQEVVHTFTSKEIISSWHVLYMGFNLTERKYRMLQFDNYRYPPSDKAYPTSAATMTPWANLSINGRALSATYMSMFFDNVIIVYEEI